MANTNKKRTHKDKAAAQALRTARNKARQAKARDRKAVSRLGIASFARLRKRLQKKARNDEINTPNAYALKAQIAG